MGKSVFLYVYGGDYAAMTFLRKYNVNEFYKEMLNEGVTTKIIDNGDDDCIEVKIMEFEEVDPKFVSFVKNELCDYDFLKSADIFKVELD